MQLLYQFFISLYGLAIHLASVKNNKARKWIIGRRNIFEEIQKQMNPDSKTIWIHCASLGEFEQGLPIIESLKTEFPNYQIILTFFSPSGYEIRKDYKLADHIFYLPLDSKSNAKKFVELINPNIAIFIKYEFWFNYLNELNKLNIPTIIVSAIFRPQQYFFKPYGKWFRNQLKKIDCFFVQNEQSKKLLNNIGISEVIVSGDTRFDRVFSLKKQASKFPLIEKFKGENILFIAGSTWTADDIIIKSILNLDKEIKIIIAPHEIHNERITEITKLSKNNILKYSEADTNNIKQADILIIDSIGILSQLYQYSDITYIGGGFGHAIHNIQEPISFGNPVIFGPKHHNFKEAVELVNKGGAFSVNTKAEFTNIFMQLLNNKQLRSTASNINSHYLESQTGATKKIIKEINRFLNK